MNEPGYRLVGAASAERSLARLPEAPAAAIVQFMVGPLTTSPGASATHQRGMAGLRASRRGPYRVVYEVDEERGGVGVLRIDHRADVYRPRVALRDDRTQTERQRVEPICRR